MPTPVIVGEITERSDIDRDSPVDADDLGSDWGDGFFVNQEPVLIKRDSAGNIVRAIPLSEIEATREMRRNAEMAMESAKVVDPIRSPSKTPLTTSEREKLVFIIAKRLFDWYTEEAQMSDIASLNPIRDGIPSCPDHPKGCPLTRCERRGRKITKLFASPTEVLDWLVQVVAVRARVVNKNKGWRGISQDLSLHLTREV